MAENREQRLRRRAYALWEQDGSPEGGAERYWGMAEREWMPSFAAPAKSPDSDAMPDTGHAAADKDEPLVEEKAIDASLDDDRTDAPTTMHKAKK